MSAFIEEVNMLVIADKQFGTRKTNKPSMIKNLIFIFQMRFDANKIKYT